MFGLNLFCLNSIDQFSPIAAASMLVRYHVSPEVKLKAQNMFYYIHAELMNLINNSNWVDEKIKLKILEKAKGIRAYIGYDDRIFNNSFIDAHYEGVTFL